MPLERLTGGRDDACRDADAPVEHGALPVGRAGPEGHEVLDRLVGVGKGVAAGDLPDQGKDLCHGTGDRRGDAHRIGKTAFADPVDDAQEPRREAVGRAEQEAVVGAAGRAEPPGVVALGPAHEEHAARVCSREGDAVGSAKTKWDYVYEPDSKAVIDDLLIRYVEALIYQAVAENMASEQSARMVAMKSASDNAKTVIGELKLVYNKTRQAAITKELSEIVGGAAAV